MRVRLEEDRCMGAGVCAQLAPEVFRVGDEGISEILVEYVQGSLVVKVREAVARCPTSSLALEED